jgi:AcrR family transcriptional regulator
MATTPQRQRRTQQDGAVESERQAELLVIAGQLFAQRGYAATTVRDIAEAAGILSGSLYHHFDSKEGILDAILSSFLSSMIERYEEVLAARLGPRESLRGLVSASLVAMDKLRDPIVIYQNEARYLAGLPRFAYLQTAAVRFRTIWVGVLHEGIAQGEMRADLEPRLVYRFVRDTIWTTARWYTPGGDHTAQQVADQYVAVLLDGITVRPGAGA